MFEEINWILIQIAAAAQLAFVAIWIVQPWWEHWVGRALMVHSLGFLILLLVSVIFHYFPPTNENALEIEVLQSSIFTLLAVGALSQFMAIGYEVYKARREKRNLLPDA